RAAAGGRGPLAGGGGVPGRQGAVRPGPAPGPPLALLVPVGDAGHAGPGVPGGGRGHRAPPPPTPVGAHPVDLQRGPAPVRRRGLPACRRPYPPVALVVVAAPPPGPRPCLPLPPTSQRTGKVTNSGGVLSSIVFSVLKATQVAYASTDAGPTSAAYWRWSALAAPLRQLSARDADRG